MSSARELVEHQYSEGGLLFPWLTTLKGRLGPKSTVFSAFRLDSAVG